MSYRTTNLPSHLRNPSLSGSASSTSQSSALQQRINEKRAELENLKQLRDLSAGLAGQMEQLEERLATLSDGTEGLVFNCMLFTSTTLTIFRVAVAAVLSNWHTVLRSIHMASGTYTRHGRDKAVSHTDHLLLAHIPKAKDVEQEQEDDDNNNKGESNVPLPQTLVRIPVQDLPSQQHRTQTEDE